MIVQIETTTNCNFRCWFCQNAHYEVPAKQVMPINLFEKILDKLLTIYPPPLPLISFATYNEPAIDPHFIERLRLLSGKGFTYWWISNGSGFSEELINFIINEKPATTDLLINTASSDPLELSSSVGISERVAKEHLEQLHNAMIRLEAHKKFTLSVNGDGGPEHQARVEKMKLWAQLPHVAVKQNIVMDRAGMLPGIGKSFTYPTDSKLYCAASYLSNLYIGVSGEVFLCCHDYFKKTAYADILSANFHPHITSPEKSAALKLLNNDFCSHCEFAVSLQREPLKALKFAMKPYKNRIPHPLARTLRKVYRWLSE